MTGGWLLRQYRDGFSTPSRKRTERNSKAVSRDVYEPR
jgi:hypothetical protein